MPDTVLDLGHREMKAYVARGGADRGVVVLHELFGLVDDIRRITDRFAANGYFAVAPDLFDGRGRGPLCIFRALRDLSKGGGAVLDDVEAVRSWMVDEGLGSDAIGVAGFCMGGGFAVLAAGQGAFAVAAPFYGDVPRNPAKVPKLCPTVASFAELDRSFSYGGDILRDHLDRQGVPHDVKVYEGVGHSFMSDQPWWARPIRGLPPMHVNYDEAAAEDAWGRVLGFFDAHLGAAGSA